MTLNQNQFYCVYCQKRVTSNADDICLKKMKNKRTHKTVHALTSKHLVG